MQANSAAGTALLKSIGVDLSDLDVLLGLTCSAVTVVGVGSGDTCSGTTVSCSSGIIVSSRKRSYGRLKLTVAFSILLVSAVSPSPLEWSTRDLGKRPRLRVNGFS